MPLQSKLRYIGYNSFLTVFTLQEDEKRAIEEIRKEANEARIEKGTF